MKFKIYYSLYMCTLLPILIKFRSSVVCAKGLAKREFFRLPDVFAKIIVDGSGQHYTTKTVKGTLDPKWNDHFDL